MLNVLQNQQFTFSPTVEVRDTGWTISGNKATHLPCNPGTMRSVGSLGLVVGKSYVVTYEVTGFVSGTVKVLLGTTSGTVRSAAGVYTQTLLCAGIPQISFFSDGQLTVADNLSFYESVQVVDNAITVAFYDGEGNNKKWVTRYSWKPGLMIKFINKFFAVNTDGSLWLQNANETRNNFFGVQYVSQIQFYDNINPTQHKIYYSLRCQSNTPWYCPQTGDITLTPGMGRSVGMSSRLKKNNYRNYQGSFYADFMRNMNDSRFAAETALYKGEPLRGRLMELMVTNADTTEAVLYEIDIKSSPSMLTY